MATRALITPAGWLRVGGRAAVGARSRIALQAAACGAPLVSAGVLAFSSGGYYAKTWGPAAIALLGMLAAAALLSRGGWGGRAGLAALGGWAGLAIWQGVSGAWAADPAAATSAMNRTLLYTAAFGLVLVGMRRADWLRWLVDAVLALTAAVAAAAVGARLLPGLLGGDETARLSFPVGYWNGLGALMAMGLVLAVGVAAGPGRTRIERLAGGGLVPLFAVGLLLTISRGAVLALLPAALILILAAPGRLEALAVLLATIAVSLPLLLDVNGSGLTALWGALPPHEADGRRAAIILVATMAAAGAAALGARRLVAVLPLARRRAAGWGALAAGLLVLGIGIAVHPPAGGPVSWADRQVAAFQSFDPSSRANAGTVADRLAAAGGSGRWQNWSVAGQEFERAPIVGVGAGDYRLDWAAERPIDQNVQNAHSLYLEVLGESGLIGLALLLIPGLAVAFVVARALRRSPPPGLARDLVTAVAAASVVAVHAGVDWDWQLPTVMLPAIVLTAGALKAAVVHAGANRTLPRGLPWAAAAACIAALVLAIGPAVSAIRTDDARALAAHGDLRGALDVAGTARQADPRAAAPALLEANILSDLGRPRAADAAFAAALLRSPRDWTVMADWAAALLARGDARAARLLIARARPLNPREPRIAYLAERAR